MSRILIVDDDTTIIKLLSSIFETAGHHVYTVSQSTEVMAFLGKTQVDAVVLDIVMPDLDGWTLLRRIRDNQATRILPVVLLSSLNDVSHKVRGIRDGASDYMVKPCEPEELIARVERLVERRVTESSDLQGQLDAFSLEELFQGFEQYGKTGVLEVTSAGESGYITIQDGHMFKAEFGRLQGHLAVETLMELKDGVFHFKNKATLDETEKGSPQIFSSLLMNAAWIKDELHVRKKRLPPGNAKLRIIDDVPPLGDKFHDLPLEGVMTFLKQHPEASVNDVMGMRFSSPNRVRLTLTMLIDYETLAVELGDDAENPHIFSGFIHNLQKRTSGDLHLYALVDQQSKALLPVLFSYLGVDLTQELAEKLKKNTGLFQIEIGDQSAMILFESLEGKSYPEQHKQFSFSGCMILLEKRLPKPKLYKLLRDFHGQTGRAANLYLYTTNDQIRDDLLEVVPDIKIGQPG